MYWLHGTLSPGQSFADWEGIIVYKHWKGMKEELVAVVCPEAGGALERNMTLPPVTRI